jgi:beta-galactosidase
VAEDTLRTAGKPHHLLLTTALDPLAPSPATTGLPSDWNDIAYVAATLVDQAGTPIPDTTTVVHFTTKGPGQIIAVDNGNLLDHDSFQATQRKLYNGTALAILRATAPSGTIQVTASVEGVAPITLTLKTTPTKPLTIQRSF